MDRFPFLKDQFIGNFKSLDLNFLKIHPICKELCN